MIRTSRRLVTVIVIVVVGGIATVLVAAAVASLHDFVSGWNRFIISFRANAGQLLNCC